MECKKSIYDEPVQHYFVWPKLNYLPNATGVFYLTLHKENIRRLLKHILGIIKKKYLQTILNGHFDTPVLQKKHPFEINTEGNKN